MVEVERVGFVIGGKRDRDPAYLKRRCTRKIGLANKANTAVPGPWTDRVIGVFEILL